MYIIQSKNLKKELVQSLKTELLKVITLSNEQFRHKITSNIDEILIRATYQNVL